MIIAISGKMQSGKNTVASIIQYLTSDKFKASNSNTFNKYKSMNYDLYKKGFIGNTIWQQVAFAGKLKQIVSILTGIPVEDLEKQEVKDKVLGKEWLVWKEESTFDSRFKKLHLKEPLTFGICKKVQYTVRRLLQEVGTEAMRDIIHPNIWVNALFADYKPLFKSIPNFRQPDDIDDMPIEYPNWIITDTRFPNELQAVKDRGGITIRVNRSRIIKHSKNISYEFNPLLDKEHLSETSLDNSKFDYVIDNNSDVESLIDKVKEILIKEKII